MGRLGQNTEPLWGCKGTRNEFEALRAQGDYCDLTD